MALVQVVAVEQHQDCTLAVVTVQYRSDEFEVLIRATPRAWGHGSLADACRAELEKLFDALMDWQVADRSAVEVDPKEAVAA